MKKILLIGDSIRKGYDKQVREALAGQAEVYFPAENCRFAQYVLRNVSEWKAQLALDDVDLVHWNAGLWDTLRLAGDFEPLTPPEVYRDFIVRCEARIRHHFPGAKQIFATSTRVIEERFERSSAYRLNADIARYNALAREALEPLGVGIDDLFAVTENLPERCWSDMTHLYTPEGTQILTGAVLRSLADALELEIPDAAAAFRAQEQIIGI